MDALRIVQLQTALTKQGAKLFTARDKTLHLATLRHPLLLRRKTFDVYAALEIFVWGEYRVAETWTLDNDATVIDLGGNIGLSSVYFDSIFPSCRFVIVEPDADNVRVLQKNCGAMLEDARAVVVEAFISATDGLAAIDRSCGSMGYRMAPPSVNRLGDVRRISMETLIRENRVETIALLKCDVEGAEAELFANCASWIKRVDKLIVETHAPYSPPRLEADLIRNGWSFTSLVVRDDVNMPQTSQSPANAKCIMQRH